MPKLAHLANRLKFAFNHFTRFHISCAKILLYHIQFIHFSCTSATNIISYLHSSNPVFLTKSLDISMPKHNLVNYLIYFCNTCTSLLCPGSTPSLCCDNLHHLCFHILKQGLELPMVVFSCCVYTTPTIQFTTCCKLCRGSLDVKCIKKKDIIALYLHLVFYQLNLTLCLIKEQLILCFEKAARRVSC